MLWLWSFLVVHLGFFSPIAIRGLDLPSSHEVSGPGPPAYRSACANGGSVGSFGFACPHMMLLTDSMLRFAQNDGWTPSQFLYGVGSMSTDDQCGACFQVQVLDGEREWRDGYAQWIIQIVNSGGDVGSTHLDIFMGAGGFGLFTALNSDCFDAHCPGGPCQDFMFDSPYETWNQNTNNNGCYGGGIKLLSGDEQIRSACARVDPNGRAWASDNDTIASCIRTNEAALHQNFVSMNFLRVACPNGMVQATGLRRQDEEDLPLPCVDNVLERTCTGDRTKQDFCITTMHDGCVFSCSWPGKGNPDPRFSQTYVCDKDGSILV